MKYRRQRTLGPLGIELQMFVRQHVGAVNISLILCNRSNGFNRWPIFPSPVYLLKNICDVLAYYVYETFTIYMLWQYFITYDSLCFHFLYGEFGNLFILNFHEIEFFPCMFMQYFSAIALKCLFQFCFKDHLLMLWVIWTKCIYANIQLSQ